MASAATQQTINARYETEFAGSARMFARAHKSIVGGITHDHLWCALLASVPGGVTCMGSDAMGSLGNGSPLTNSSLPVLVTGLP